MRAEPARQGFEHPRIAFETAHRHFVPFEIEQRLQAHPAVAEAAVIGVDHRDLGEQIKAVVVFHDGPEVAIDELQRWVAEALAYYKVPSQWEVRKEPLPRNATGKVLKQLLRDAQDSMFIEE